MNPAIAAVARTAAVVIVLIAAAALGLVVGNYLDARDGGAIAPGAGITSAPHVGGFDGARESALRARRSDLPDTVFPNVWGNIEAPEPVTSESWGNIAAADDGYTQTWGNLDERHDARSSDETSGRTSLTAPTPR
jgi:hypothetical protein